MSDEEVEEKFRQLVEEQFPEWVPTADWLD